MNRVYNYKFQNHDERDYIFKPPKEIHNLSSIDPKNPLSAKQSLPQKYFITDNPLYKSPILDQEYLGSCVANSVKSMMFTVSTGKVDLSRLQLYMCFREIDGSSLTEDTGGTVRGAMKAVAQYGVCQESIWPYIISKFARLAPSKAFTSTYKLNNFVYTSIKQDLEIIKSSLTLNLPIVLGIMIYSSFETPFVDKYGIIPIPDTKKERILGGHCILLVGYDDSKSYFKFQNSWGTNWGDSGYGYIPYQYILNTRLSSDLWNMYFTM